MPVLTLKYKRARGEGWDFDYETLLDLSESELISLAIDACSSVAMKTGETPRTIIERMFHSATTDEEWRELVGDDPRGEP